MGLPADKAVRYSARIFPSMLNGVPEYVTSTSPDQRSPESTHILVVDDDSSIRQMVADYLGDNDMKVTALASGNDIARVTGQQMIDLLILDLKMPGENGMEIARRIRAESSMPIIMLTGCKEEADRVMALELGADDYLTKPFSPRELLARIRALLRRPREIRPESIRISDLVLNTGNHTATRAGRLIGLTAKEYALLEFLMLRPNRIVNREQIAQHVWDENFDPLSNVIDVYVRRLRAKIDEGFAKPLIHTRRGEGYLMSAEREIAGA